jgi:hypothetical protein
VAERLLKEADVFVEMEKEQSKHRNVRVKAG